MMQLVSVLYDKILNMVKQGETNIVRIESIDDPVIYHRLCEKLQPKIKLFIPKMTLEKYDEFQNAENPHWVQALAYFHKGQNPCQEPILDAQYKEKSYVDFHNAMTKWRNASADIEADGTCLILLMGTEMAPDTGGLADTSFLISPKELITALSKDYSAWFSYALDSSGLDRDTAKSIHALYKSIFSVINLNIFKMSDFIDDLNQHSFISGQELINHICETLPQIWGIPKVIDSAFVPRLSKLKSGRASDAAIIKESAEFIGRNGKIPSKAAVQKMERQFKEYAKKKGISEAAPFPSDDVLFESYADFQSCVLDFLSGKNVDTNRQILLQIDFSIIHQIISTKLQSTATPKPISVDGDPLEVYASMFLQSISKFTDKTDTPPMAVKLRIDHISLTDCIESQKEESYYRLCNYLGGLLDFFQAGNMEYAGQPLTFSYMGEDGFDPFDSASYEQIEGCVKCAGKWGEPSKITFTVEVSNSDMSQKCDFKWAFSPYSPWLHAFDYLNSVYESEGQEDIPTLVYCEHMGNYLGCESEDAFYAQMSNFQGTLLASKHHETLRQYFGTEATDGYSIYTSYVLLRKKFKDFVAQLNQGGFFCALEQLRAIVAEYTCLMELISDNYHKLQNAQQEKIPLFLHLFMITSNAEMISNGHMGEVIVPAYHPVMLEKIDAKHLYMRDGFNEMLQRLVNTNIKDSKIKSDLQQLVQLSSITQAVDSVLAKNQTYLTCKEMWEYCGVYYDDTQSGELFAGNKFTSSIVVDDETATVMLRATPSSNIITRNVLDYVRTFPSRIDGLQIAFIAPADTQHIVAAIHKIASLWDKENITATIHVKIISLNSNKNSASYLRHWLDSYFSDDRSVKVYTYLRNLVATTVDEVESLDEMLQNDDLCFTYNILKAKSAQFEPTAQVSFDKDQAKFPMMFTPDAVASTYGKSRNLGLSQFQFIASKEHTQASYKVGYPYSKEGVYRVLQKLELEDLQSAIIEKAHEQCRWVVCVDPALDRKMLCEADGLRNSKIIGFTTGEGCYGELNVTVSANRDILKEIKSLLRKRLTEKFPSWSFERLNQATQYCVDELSDYMDGSRILKALNPYDYEVHSFLAYVLTIQLLGMTSKSDQYIMRRLVSLDSYAHWFSQSDATNSNDTRPDFLLIEIPRTEHNLNPSASLQINMKIIECKMGYANENQVSHAREQLEKGIQTMSTHWNPLGTGVMHRYWLNQLYRTVIFSPLDVDDASPEYNIVRDKIYQILQGKYEVDWSGDLFAFWLDSAGDTVEKQELVSSLPSTLREKGVRVEDFVYQSCGQVMIQKLLVPDMVREEVFSYEQPSEVEEDIAENDVEPSGDIGSPPVESSITVEPEIIVTSEIADGETFTTATVIEEEDTLPAAQSLADEAGSSPVPIDNNENTQTPEPIALEVANDILIAETVIPQAPTLSSVRLLLGEDMRTKQKIYWEFGNKELNNRHLLINGNSGCGKTYCIQTLLMEAALQRVSSVVFDYTGGFTASKLDPKFREVLGDRIQQRVVRASKIPVNPFQKNEIQIDEDISVPEEDGDVASKIAEIFSTVYRLGDQQKSAVYSAVLNGMRSYGEQMNFLQMREELEALDTSYAKTVLSKIQAFTDINPFQSDNSFSWENIRDSQGIVYVIQLAGYTRDVQVLLTELLLWDIWNFCVKTGDETKPFVLVLDEAQNLSHGEKSPSAKILTEGRKFGLSGWYATQFMKPQLSDDEIQRLQQAGQKLYFCPPDEGVMTVAKNIDITPQGGREWAERLKKLKKGECVTCGNMVRNEKFSKYQPTIIKVSSLESRVPNDESV